MLFLLFALACAKLPPTSHGPAFTELKDALAAEGVELLPAVLIEDQLAPALPALKPPTEIEARLRLGEEYLGIPTVLDPAEPQSAAFLRNDYIGAVRFGGGLIRTGETALEVRARLIEFSAQPDLRQQGAAWLDETARAVLAGSKVPVLAPAGGFVPPPVIRRPIRGFNEEDGHDNLNLPRVAIEPAAAEPGADGPRWVMVPYLRGYVMHNGGWFLGQEWGCPGGARVEALLVVYDRRSGQPAWWQAATGRHIQEMKSQPSRAQMDQFMLWAEDRVEVAFEKGFLR